MDERQNTILKNPLRLSRAGRRLRPRRVDGLLVATGAVLVLVLASTSSGATPPVAQTPAGAAAHRPTIVRDPLAKVTGANTECREGWSMSKLHAGTVWVGDPATGRIDVYRLDGTRLRVIDTGLGRDGLAGFALGPDGRLSVLGADHAPVSRLAVGS